MITIDTIPNPAWYIYRANCVSLGKRPRPGKVLDRAWCLAQLHAQHSSLEHVLIYVFDDACVGSAASHLVRHTKAHPRCIVESWRPDWTGLPRPHHDMPRQLLIAANPLALIEIMRQRLCATAAAATRALAARICAELRGCSDVLLQALGEYCMPDCEYRGQVCHQSLSKTCGRSPHWTTLAAKNAPTEKVTP